MDTPERGEDDFHEATQVFRDLLKQATETDLARLRPNIGKSIKNFILSMIG